MKIVRLNSTNVKRLRAVEITPDGNVVVVGGRNGQGKSSVLDSIMYALGGRGEVCREPIRRGTTNAEVSLDLGDLTVTRTFDKGGESKLIIETKDGGVLRHPQGRLDSMLGTLSFDPLDFLRMTPLKQAETLRELLGLDFTLLDAERLAVFDKRTEVNRDGKALRARFEALEHRADVPTEEISTATLLREIESGETVNRGHADLRKAAADADASVNAAVDEVNRLQEQLSAARNKLGELQGAQAAARENAKALVDVDVAPIKEKLAGADAVNAKVRENTQRAQLEAELEEQLAKSRGLTERITAIDDQKRRSITDAKFPVAGLSFDAAGGVVFNELPLDQASSAEQLRVSVAIGLALNPKLRVLLIRDGSLLDKDSLQLIGQLADEHDAQLWIERVENEGATVIIEDGAVLKTAPAEVAP